MSSPPSYLITTLQQKLPLSIPISVLQQSLLCLAAGEVESLPLFPTVSFMFITVVRVNEESTGKLCEKGQLLTKTLNINYSTTQEININLATSLSALFSICNI